MIRGISVVLVSKTCTGVDAFNRPTYSETETTVNNVIVAPMSDEEVLSTLNLTGRKAVYQLGIPKGDTNDWIDKEVRFFGKSFRTIGEPVQGIEDMIPLSWNKKVRVEVINGG